MNLALKSIFVILIVVILLFYFEVFSIYTIEEKLYRYQAYNSLLKIKNAKVPSDLYGEAFQYKDGWLVVIYGNSKLQHNRWHYHLAIDSANRIYFSQEHLCCTLPFVSMVASYSPHDSVNKIYKEPETFQEIEYLKDASIVLSKKGFKLK